MNMSSLSEFDLIKTYFERLGPQSCVIDSRIVSLGIGDDCAVINVPDGMSLCFSMDTMVEGVHFPVNAPPDKLAYRALAAALSDLAAMGAKPSHFTLSLTMPSANHEWLASFSAGLQVLVEKFNFPLLGGDTTKGSLAIAIQVHGFVSKEGYLTRSGAKAGDILAVTGTLGDAGAALDLLGKVELDGYERFLLDRYYKPTPRVPEGLVLRSLANSCIDISDGLLADAGHVSAKSGVRLHIDVESLPLSHALKVMKQELATEFAMSAGDDYELLFSISEKNWKTLNQISEKKKYTQIGRVVTGSGLSVVRQGSPIRVKRQGFKHFE